MSDPTYILAWHPYHAGFLIGVIASIAERLTEIHASKPSEEWPLRERLLKPVAGKLPEELVRAGAELNRARAWAEIACAGAELNRARAWAEIVHTGDELVRASVEWRRASVEWDRLYSVALPEIEALHATECPDCPWDGNSIFGGQAK